MKQNKKKLSWAAYNASKRAIEKQQSFRNERRKVRNDKHCMYALDYEEE